MKDKGNGKRITITTNEVNIQVAERLAKHYQVSISALIRMLIANEGRRILGS